MPDAKTVVGAILLALFNALVRTYSREALWHVFVASVSVYLMVVWRSWFGESHWRLASVALAIVLFVAVVTAAWRFGISPRLARSGGRNSRSWRPGDPLPTSDFPIAVRFDAERAMRLVSVESKDPKRRPVVFSVASRLTLANTSSDDIAVELALVVPQPRGRVAVISADVGDLLPIGAVTPEQIAGTVQFRRIVNLPRRNAVIGYVGFKLTDRLPGDSIEVPELAQYPQKLQTFAARVPSDEVPELLGAMKWTMDLLLRVTNRLDGSYRDFPPIGLTSKDFKVLADPNVNVPEPR